MDIAKLEENFNRGRFNIDDIKELIVSVRQLRHEKEILLEDNNRLRRTVGDLRKKTGFRIFEENLRLSEELQSVLRVSETNNIPELIETLERAKNSLKIEINLMVKGEKL
ncbi:hypothetical protein BIV60_13805 [Bacillus sp. MUM 116]|uniref:hypothetical protein n=1 Tax=Bacillus sp. MUM 116 TaxID=1678002 RepID=UPI0008F56939|nr:hypothetical protein [Bacillus sp. MUM 116]OIK13565.1 hypothetical protein BIV60_13805 [Bacillus sp. MUM 116]